MNIVHFTNHFWPCEGGIEKVVEDLCIQSKKKGHGVSVVCLNQCHAGGKKLKERETWNGIPVHRVPFADLKYYKIAPHILKYAKKADVLHVHGLGFFSDYLALTKWLHRKPMVLSTHGAIFHTESIQPLKQAYFYGLQKLLMESYDAIAAVSENDLKLFEKLSNRVQLIENAVDLKRFAPGKKNPNTFLYVGRLSKNKRLDRLLKAFAGLKKIGKSFDLAIIGEDWDGIGKELKQESNRLGLEKNVQWIGKASGAELKQWYERSEFFVSASQYEGFGLTLIESMASGCIPIVNQIPSFEKILENGKNGFLCDFESEKNASKALMEAMESSSAKKKRFRESAVQAAERYDWIHRMKEWIALYDRVAGKAE